MFQTASAITASPSTGTATAETRGHHDQRARGCGGAARRAGHHLRADRLQQPVAQLRRRLSLGGGEGQRRGHRLHLAQLHAAALARLDVLEHQPLVGGIEAVQGVSRDQLVDVFHSCSGFMPDWASSSRRAAIAAKVRLLTVPIGSASRSASSDCVYPAK